MKILRYVPVLIFILWGGFANAESFFDVPSPLPSEIKGEAWEHPLATLTGSGKVRFRDRSVFLDEKYEGDISCDVAASAPENKKNKVEVNTGSDGTDIKAKTKSGTIHVYNCKVDDVPIAEFPELMDKKVKIEIEGFVEIGEMEPGTFVYQFSEYEAEGKMESGWAPKVKLELENGTITLVMPPDDCIDCGGGGVGGGVGGPGVGGPIGGPS